MVCFPIADHVMVSDENCWILSNTLLCMCSLVECTWLYNIIYALFMKRWRANSLENITWSQFGAVKFELSIRTKKTLHYKWVTRVVVYACRGLQTPTLFKGLFTWRREVPRRRFNFTLGLHAEILVRVVVWEGIKNGGRQKQTYNLGLSALFTGVNNFLSAELSQ